MTREEFLFGMNDWCNHLPLLWLALEETQGEVLEMGCGDGSTRQLHSYCKGKRKLYSFDTEQKWIDEFKDCQSEDHIFTRVVNHWEIAQEICPKPSVILVDHAPGERRIVDIKNYSDKIEGIMVIHDTQPPPTGADYGFERIWGLFKYRVNLEVPKNGKDNRTWASAVSNHHNFDKWKGLKFLDYVIK